MQRRDAALGQQARDLLAEHGIEVSEEGVARARSSLHEAEARTTPADWRRLGELIDNATL